MMGTRPPVKVTATIIPPDLSDPLSDGRLAVAIKLKSEGAPMRGFAGRGKTLTEAVVALVEQMIERQYLKMPDAQR